MTRLEYSEHQKKIVRGEIPFEDVLTEDLLTIQAKAHHNGDYELFERVFFLIRDRQKDSQCKRNLCKRARDRHGYVPKRGKMTDWADDDDSSLTKWEKAILMGLVDLDECSEKELEHILRIVQKQGDEDKIRMASEKSISQLKNSSTVINTASGTFFCATLSISELMSTPIRV